jgi:hypothetical protein
MSNPANIPLPPDVPRAQMKHDIHKFRAVTRLTDSNWVIHKFEQVAAMQERDLWDVVSGVDKEPKDKKSEEWQIWHSKDVSARAQIIQNLSPEIQPAIYETTTSAQAWQALRDDFESSNLNKIANVHLIYDTLAYIKGTPMRDHINQLKILREQLGAMGDQISDTSHALRLLRHLPSSWEGVCQVLRASQPTVTKVKDRLLAEEQARKTQEAFINAGNAQALTAALTQNLDPAAATAFQALITTQFGSLSLNPSATSQTQGSGPSKGSKGQ